MLVSVSRTPGLGRPPRHTDLWRRRRSAAAAVPGVTASEFVRRKGSAQESSVVASYVSSCCVGGASAPQLASCERASPRYALAALFLGLRRAGKASRFARIASRLRASISASSVASVAYRCTGSTSRLGWRVRELAREAPRSRKQSLQ